MENQRLLTKSQIEAAERCGNSTVPAYGSGAAEHRSAENQAICEAQDAKTRKMTLNIVGLRYDADGELVNYPTAETWRAIMRA